MSRKLQARSASSPYTFDWLSLTMSFPVHMEAKESVNSSSGCIVLLEAMSKRNFF